MVDCPSFVSLNSPLSLPGKQPLEMFHWQLGLNDLFTPGMGNISSLWWGFSMHSPASFFSSSVQSWPSQRGAMPGHDRVPRGKGLVKGEVVIFAIKLYTGVLSGYCKIGTRGHLFHVNQTPMRTQITFGGIWIKIKSWMIMASEKKRSHIPGKCSWRILCPGWEHLVHLIKSEHREINVRYRH